MEVISQNINPASSGGTVLGRRAIKIEWILRISLGLMYLYSGADLIMHPKSWTWAVPWWFPKFITPFVPLDTYLQLQGGVEVLMALIFLILFIKGRIIFAVAIFSSFELLFIMLFVPQFATVFRDLGAFGASVALCFLIWNRILKNSNVQIQMSKFGA